MRRRTVLISAAGAATAAATASLLSACKSDDQPAWSQPSTGSSASPVGDASPAPGDAAFSIVPAAGATGVSPGEPVVVTATNATLTTVAVTNSGKAVVGTLDADGKTWRSTGPLGYNRTYQVTASGTGADGQTVQKTGSFTTVKPGSTASVTFQANAMTSLQNGATYGVGQVVIARFSKTPSDKTAALRAIEITSEPAVEGRWYWVDSRTAHYRPEQYWVKGTKVSVHANMVGANLGKGVYGDANKALTFTIGPARIAIAENKTHRMIVTIDGVQVKNIPISMGKDGYVTTATGDKVLFPTRSGTHVVMSRELEHQMSSASYGVTDPKNPNYYDELIKLCCRISYSGEFVHAAPWSVGSQGKRNVSHGCINISTPNAQWFYDNFRLGDVVVVRNTGRAQQIGDSAGAVWDIPWNKMIAV